MTGALVVIPLAAMVIPIALILLAVLVDIVYVGWTIIRLWHDEWAVPVAQYVGSHVVQPLRHMAHPHGPAR